MANLAATAVVKNYSYTTGGLADKLFQVVNVTLTLTGQGSTTNTIPASVLGFTTIVKATPAIKSDNTVIVPAGPSADGTLLLLGGGASNAPADYTGTFTLEVSGEI